MLIYYLIFILLLFFAIAEQIFEKIPFFFGSIVLALLVLLAGLRGSGVSRDYDNYIEIFRQTGTIKEYFTNYDTYFFFEPIFYFIVSLMLSLFKDIYFPIFLLFAFVGVATKGASIKRFSPFPYLSLFVFFPTIFFLHDMTQIRIGMAGGLYLWLALPLLIENKSKWKYFLYCFLVGLIHYSCLLFIFLPLLNRQELNKIKYLALLSICFLLSFLRIDFMEVFTRLPIGAISMKMQAYKEAFEFIEVARVNIFNTIFLARVALALFLLWVLGKTENPRLILFVKMYLLSLSSFLLFSGTAFLAFRISEVFGIIEFIVLAYLVKSVSFRLPVFCTVVTYASICFFLTLIIEKNIQEYSSVLW